MNGRAGFFLFADVTGCARILDLDALVRFILKIRGGPGLLGHGRSDNPARMSTAKVDVRMTISFVGRFVTTQRTRSRTFPVQLDFFAMAARAARLPRMWGKWLTIRACGELTFVNEQLV
jgi:hypothetical protein